MFETFKFVKKFAIVTLVISMAAMPALATNGMNMIGFGARMSAMGGVGQGFSGDANLMFANPAVLAGFDGQQFAGGVGLLMPKVNFTNDYNDVEGESQMFPLPNVAWANGLGDNPWAFGFGVSTVGGMGATYKDVNHPIFVDYYDNQMEHGYIGQEYHSQIAMMRFTPSVAYNVSDNFRLGLGLQIAYSTLQMAMPYSMDPLAMQGDTGMGRTFGDLFSAAPNPDPMIGGLGYDEVTAYADMKDGATATGYGANFGFQYDLNDNITFGFSYTSQTDLTYEGDASMDMNSQFGNAYERMIMGWMNNGFSQAAAIDSVNMQLVGMGMDMSLGMADTYDAEIAFAWPQQIGFGAAVELSENFTIGLDVGWINWSATMEAFEMTFSGGTNENINTMMGTPDGNIELEMPLNWDDQIVIGFGAEYWLNDSFAFRGGFNYASNPVPENTLIAIFPAVVESHVTLGLGYWLNPAFGVDLGYEYVLGNDPAVKNSIIANEYNDSVSELSENVLHLTLVYNF